MSFENAFAILGHEPKYNLDLRVLERKQREAFVARQGEGALALEAINEAYRLLKAPLTRAELFFELRGWSTQTRPEPATLERVFAERERIELARASADVSFLSDWVGAARKRQDAVCASLGQILDAPGNSRSAEEAAALLEQLRFLSRALAAAEASLVALEESTDEP